MQPASEDAPTLAEPLSRSPSRDPYVGTTIDDRYVVEHRIGQGGMGVVYLARHKLIDKRFAIKVLRVEMVGAPDHVRRFLTEARAASSIGNPHIVDVVDFGQLPDSAPYFVMEHLEGVSLATRMAERRGLPFAEVMRIAAEIADGLHAAHEAGIVHRDLKPDNVMLQRGGDHPDFVKVLDFGVAKVGVETARETVAGTVLGTPHYMSPEQAEGKSVDRRTDIYSLGVMMYEMTVGRVPFQAENFMGILNQHVHKPATPVGELRLDVPPVLEAIIQRCMAKAPSDRFATMTELIAALGVGAVGGQVALVTKPRQRGSRAAWLGLGAMVVFFAVGLFFARSALHRRAARADAPTSLAPIADALPTASAKSADSVAANVPTAANLRTVFIIASPLDATIARDDIVVGVSPQEISIALGETARITVSRDGFLTRTVSIDGAKPRVEVQLQPRHLTDLAAPPPRASAIAKPRCPPGQTLVHDQCTGF